MSIEAQARSLLHLFSPGRHGYGTLSAVGVPGPDGKLKKKQLTKRETLTDALVVDHLRDASKTVGFVPFVDDEHCRFGSADIDEYAKDIGPELARKFAGTPIIVARSPSGGTHLHRISDKDVTAVEMIAYFHDVIENDLPAQDGIDCIFPKQEKIDIANGGVGNYINAPLAGILGDKEHRLDRCIYDDNGEPITDLDLALDFIESKIAPLPKTNGATPPEKPKAGRTLGVRDLREVTPGSRSDTLISLGSSMIARGLEFETQVEPLITATFNDWREHGDDLRENRDGVPVELAGILKNLKRKADKQPTDGFSNLIELRPFVPTKKDRRAYQFNYNGTPIKIENADKLFNAAHIKTRVFEETGRIERMTQGAWLDKLEALREASVNPHTGELDFEIDADTRSATIFEGINNAVLESFNRAKTYHPTTRERILSPVGGGGAHAWLDPKTRRIYFLPDAMVATVNTERTLSLAVDRAELLDIVRAAGGTAQKKTLAPGVSKRLFWIPCPDHIFEIMIDPTFDGIDEHMIGLAQWNKRNRKRVPPISDKTAKHVDAQSEGIKTAY